MSNEHILITGTAGMVGSHLLEYYSGKVKKEFLIGTYFNPTINLYDILNLCVPLELDIRHAHAVEKIIHEFKPGKIFHLAAQSIPTISWLRPIETMDINANGTINLFEAILSAQKLDAAYNPVVVVACSSAEYGASLTPENVPIKENAALLPLHPYGVSKVAQDLLTFQYFKGHNIRGIRARIFNTTGSRKTNDAVSDFVQRALNISNGKIEKFRVGNLTSQRAITDVRDLVSALVLLAEKGTAGEAYNISGEKVYSMMEIIEVIEKVCERKFILETDQSLLRPTDEPIIFGDSTKLKTETGWQQKYSLEETVNDMLSYLKRK
ncbi:MAG: NAD-dependent epimerase/dehydratase family protein [Sphingobacteriales bacterium]|nr:MAG: NAD-dependent epimerase/dehydratase family protein [Sphingobacteriales bacterium]